MSVNTNATQNLIKKTGKRFSTNFPIKICKTKVCECLLLKTSEHI